MTSTHHARRRMNQRGIRREAIDFTLRWGGVYHRTGIVFYVLRRCDIERSVKGPLKDHDSRFVPILDALSPVLRDWLLRRGPGSPLFPPPRPRRAARVATSVYPAADAVEAPQKRSG